MHTAYYDAQIWTAGRLNQIPVVLSEDSATGAAIEGVTFLNPLDPSFGLDERREAVIVPSNPRPGRARYIRQHPPFTGRKSIMSAERPTTLQLTYEDYLLIPDDGRRHEIIDGEEHVAPSPSTPHQRIVGFLFNQLYNHVAANRLGEVFVAPFDVILSDTDIVQPDVLFVSQERAHLVTERGVEGAPDLVVEVLSEGNRRHDEVRKRKLYARFAVAEYWIADPALETIKVYRPTDDGYVRAAELGAEDGDTLTSPLLPGFDVSLDTIFAGVR